MFIAGNGNHTIILVEKKFKIVNAYKMIEKSRELGL